MRKSGGFQGTLDRTGILLDAWELGAGAGGPATLRDDRTVTDEFV